MREFFSKFATRTAQIAGKPITFVLSVVLILIWALTGPIFQYSDTWQLIINTGTTILTFLMVFLLQNTQNRNDLATQAKLDELIKCTRGARNSLNRIEDKDEEEIERERN